MQIAKQAKNINWALMATLFLLLSIGLINLYSALKFWGEGAAMHLFWSQAAWISVGLILLLTFSWADYRIFERMAFSIYLLSILFLVAVLIFGRVVAGHRSWLGIGGFGIQPSEFAKIAVLVILAKFYSDNPRPEGFSLIALLKPAFLCALPAGLVLLQGDLGTTLFFLLLFFSFAWFSKVRRGVIIFTLIAGILGGFLGYKYALSDYQKARIITFIDPSYDIKGSGYHLMQSRIAVGSGMFWGKGYLKGSINKLRYLPEKHTDFIFSVLAEEWGFFGCAITIGLYFTLLGIAIGIAKSARERFGTFLTIGIVAYFFWQIAINIGGVLGVMPMTGVTLPFLSYGGSSIVSAMAVVGILFSVSRKRFVF